ncbi:DUF1178 family protein [Alphaproteobacteria bacterium]|nr:DUF1178 family protein [Alphaproteobacteria bacterium]
MIKYSLICKSQYCSKQKNFDGWFQNIEAFENQKSKGLINCPLCGSDDVIKSLTTPSFRLSKVKSPEIEVKQKQVDDKNLRNSIKLNDKMNDISILLRAMKKEIKKNSEFVGDDFVKEVRSMKVDKIKERSIYGHGTKKEIEELKEEGVNVLNIPWIPDDH